jgi:hypothetical protein
MAVVSTHEMGRMSADAAESVTAHGKAGSMSADVRGCKVCAAEAAAMKTADVTAAATAASAVTATAVAAASKCIGRKRHAPERENCGPHKD